MALGALCVALTDREGADRVRAHSQALEIRLGNPDIRRWPQTASDPITWTPGTRFRD